MHNLCFFLLFFQKSLFTENYFLIAAINLATRDPLYTCLVDVIIEKQYTHYNYLLSFDLSKKCKLRTSPLNGCTSSD